MTAFTDTDPHPCSKASGAKALPPVTDVKADACVELAAFLMTRRDDKRHDNKILAKLKLTVCLIG